MKSPSFWVRLLIGALLMVVLFEGTARLAVAAFDPVATRWYDDAAELKVGQMESLSAADTVVIGTSMAWQGLVPSVLAEAGGTGVTYNAGLAGGVPQVMEPWLLDQVIPRLQPTTVIWGLASLDFSATYGEDNAATYDDALETKTGWLADVDRAVSKVSVLIRDRRQLRDPSALFGDRRDEAIEARAEAQAVLGADGERLDFIENTDDDRRLAVRQRLANYALDGTDIDAILRVADHLAAHDITLVLVALPMPPRMVEQHPRGADDAATTARAIDALAADLGVAVLRPTGDYIDSDFVDYTHLGAAAAERFSAEIAAQLPG